MITVVCVYFESWDVPPFSRCFTPEWVTKLYRGIARHTTQPFRFLCLTDGDYDFPEPIETRRLGHTIWATVLLQAYAVDAQRIAFMGLDTVITGNLDELFAYAGPLAVPRDPYRPAHACSGFVLCPQRNDIAAVTSPNDMLALDRFPHDWLDDLYPGQVVSYKGQVREHGLNGARVVYFHGEPKPHQVDESWIKEHWRAKSN